MKAFDKTAALNEAFRKIERKMNCTIPPEVKGEMVSAFETHSGAIECDDDVNYFEEGAKTFLPAIVRNYKFTAPLPKESRRTYQKCYERRLHLVSFVIDRVKISMYNLWFHNLHGKKRIPWQSLSAEWNRAFPFNRFTADSLRREYYRAIKEDQMTGDFCERCVKELRETERQNREYLINQFEGTGRKQSSDFPLTPTWLDSENTVTAENNYAIALMLIHGKDYLPKQQQKIHDYIKRTLPPI